MIGYIMLNKDMKSIYGNNMRYKLRKKYIMNKDDIKIFHSSGYQFYKKLEDCINFTLHDMSTSRFFKVEVSEYILDVIFSNMSVSNEITLLEEISREDIKKYCKENRDKINKVSLAKLGLFLDELYKDEDPSVRLNVARQGKYLSILIKDKNPFVIEEVARQGKYLSILAKYNKINNTQTIDINIEDSYYQDIYNLLKDIYTRHSLL